MNRNGLSPNDVFFAIVIGALLAALVLLFPSCP